MTSNPELSPRCRRFVLAHWGKDGLRQVTERPVSWVRYQATPYLRLLRRRSKGLPLLRVRGTPKRVYVALTTEKEAPADA
jgi:hypothetical protein